MNHNHQTHTYPAAKSVPKKELRRRTPAGKQVLKKQHTRRSRQYLNKQMKEQL